MIGIRRITPDPLANYTRAAFAGDWHASSNYARRAIRYASKQGAQVVVHLGDFGYDYRPGFVTEIERALARHRIALLFVDGNHDSPPALARYPIRSNGLRQLTDHLWHLPRGHRWTWSGRRFLALGGAVSVDKAMRTPGYSWWPGEAITFADAERASTGGPVDVLVAHDCPAGVIIPGLAESAHRWPADAIRAADRHRELLRAVVDEVRPASIWHGHYHLRYDWAGDLGYGPVQVHGMDCDGEPFDRNMQIIDLRTLSAPTPATPAPTEDDR